VRGLFTPLCGEGGASLVETALTLPLFVFLVAGTLQLAMIQHAAVMTEYAAFQAARAGIVHRAQTAPMQRAACQSLLPTLAGSIYGRTANDVAVEGRLLPDDTAGWRGLADAFCTDPTQNPLGLQVLRVQSNRGRLSQNDFDAIEGGPPNTLLTVRVLYFYPMHIPFVNGLIQAAAFAARSGTLLSGAIDRPKEGEGGTIVGDAGGGGEEAARGAVGAGDYRSVDPQLPPLMTEEDLAALKGQAAQGRLYLVPLVATYTMRMQSNVSPNP
jgi:hypothetical protein